MKTVNIIRNLSSPKTSVLTKRKIPATKEAVREYLTSSNIFFWLPGQLDDFTFARVFNYSLEKATGWDQLYAIFAADGELVAYTDGPLYSEFILKLMERWEKLQLLFCRWK
jgi:hypothetical protein